eukprot:GHVH01012074.1.p1 GENE.GHVH01012074.1~~GHVH01012074.1.p1  ORF type:complete len:194 (+),score=10.27 GHVH01012074.1:59-640(+)
MNIALSMGPTWVENTPLCMSSDVYRKNRSAIAWKSADDESVTFQEAYSQCCRNYSKRVANVGPVLLVQSAERIQQSNLSSIWDFGIADDEANAGKENYVCLELSSSYLIDHVISSDNCDENCSVGHYMCGLLDGSYAVYDCNRVTIISIDTTEGIINLVVVSIVLSIAAYVVLNTTTNLIATALNMRGRKRNI